MLTAEQFSQLATKDDLKNFATKDYLDEKLTHFATKDYLDEKLTHFATKDDFKALSDKLDLRFGQLDYKIESSFDHLNQKLDLFAFDYAMRLKKLEFKAFEN